MPTMKSILSFQPFQGFSSSWIVPAILFSSLLPWGFFPWNNIGPLFDFRLLNPPIPSFGTSVSNTGLNFTDMATVYAAICPVHKYSVHIFSLDPVIIYIEDYLTTAEVEYLLELAVSHYERSPVSKGHQQKVYDSEIRSSMSAVLPEDPVVSCIEERSVIFQGYMPKGHLEDIQVVKYGVGDSFRPHFDWFEGMKNPRLSTFFVYLACDNQMDGGACEGGATQFPGYEGRFPRQWCRFIDCKDEPGVGGIGFRPIVGNALFWQNLHSNGTGHPGVWHAGMPVKKGRKVGLNIFTRRDVWFPE